MTAGDVVVQIIDSPFTEASIDTVITAMRTSANDKWLMTSTSNGQQIVVVNIEEDA